MSLAAGCNWPLPAYALVLHGCSRTDNSEAGREAAISAVNSIAAEYALGERFDIRDPEVYRSWSIDGRESLRDPAWAVNYGSSARWMIA